MLNCFKGMSVLLCCPFTCSNKLMLASRYI